MMRYVALLAVLATAVSVAAEAITNGGFEDGLNSWDVSGVSHATDAPHWGLGCAEANNVSAWHLEQTFAEVAVSDLEDVDAVSFWARRRLPNAGGTVTVLVYYTDNSNSSFDFDLPSTVYERKTIQKSSLSLGKSVNRIRIQRNTISRAYIDDISVLYTPPSPVPGPFALASPPDGAVGRPLVGNLSWNGSANATSYDVYFGTDPVPPFVENVGGLSWTYGGNANADHFWTVVARNNEGTTPTVSGTWTFRTQLASGPELIAPEDGDTLSDQRPSFGWTSLGVGITYDIEIDDDENFGSPDFGATGLADNSWTADADIPAGQWFWRVRGDNGASGPWCESFFDVWIDITPPAQPALLFPIGSEVISTVLPELDWAPVPEARRFRVEVQNEGGTPILTRTVSQAAGQDRSSYQLVSGEELPDMANYTWRVEAADFADNWSGFGPAESFRVEKATRDVGATAIPSPSGTVKLGVPLSPAVTVENFGEQAETFTVELVISGPAAGAWQFEEEVVALGAGDSRTVTFASSWTPEETGDYTATATTKLAGDQRPQNDAHGPAGFVVSERVWDEGWVEVASVPTGDGKALKDGAWLAVGEDATDAKKVIYAAKGNKSAEFYRYDPAEGESGTWLGLAAIPADEGGKNKLPSKGCVGTFGDGSIYMTKGNNTLGFWRYDVEQDSWHKLTDVPVGEGKNIKGGNDLVYVKRQHEDGYVYLLKGGNTEFYRYNTETGDWTTLTPAPYGGGRAKYNKGSFLVYRRKGQSVHDIYVHQAAYNDGQHHYMFRYDALGDSWADGMLKGIPVYGLEGGKTKKKKSKDGAAGVWYDDAIYALKGGNTQGFFKYYPEGDSWTQEPDTVPMLGTTLKKKRVKGGGDLVLFDDAFFAFKGNKTYEFWRYVEPTTPTMATRPGRDGVAAGVIGNGEWRMGIGPNPLSSGFATLRYSLPRPGPATVTVFDVAGRSVFSTRSLGHLTTGSLSLDLRKLSAGVYLVRLDADGMTQTQKLVVQK